MNETEDYNGVSVVYPGISRAVPAFLEYAEQGNPVFEKTSVQFDADDPQTKTLSISPASGKVWYIKRISAWTDEAPPDNTNAGSKTDIDIYINGTTQNIAKSYETEQVGTTYNTCGIALNCVYIFGQRLKITDTSNGIHISATKTGAGTHTLYLQVEG
ncbi:hypothetical protein LCGC14_2141580, partial [marine sediment metagenome]